MDLTTYAIRLFAAAVAMFVVAAKLSEKKPRVHLIEVSGLLEPRFERVFNRRCIQDASCRPQLQCRPCWFNGDLPESL